jgi:lysophospholipid acyltransferase (LPLAT)-like uncharacterized protein
LGAAEPFSRIDFLAVPTAESSQSKPTPRRRTRRGDDTALRRLRRRLSGLFVLLYPVLGALIRLWVWSVHRMVRVDRRGPAFEYIRSGKPFILTFWHEDVLVFMFEMVRSFRSSPVLFMVSPGRTGDLGTYLLHLFGAKTVAGSGSLKGREAIDRIAEIVREQPQSVYILADGSRGPNQELRWGALHLARDTGLPIIGGRGWASHRVTLSWTWMRLALPLPWGRGVALTAEPLYIPADATKEDLKTYRAELERRLGVLTSASRECVHPGGGEADRFGPSVGEFPVRAASVDS